MNAADLFQMPIAGPLQDMLAASQQLSQQFGTPGQAGQPVNFSQPSSFQNNPAVNAAMGNLGAFGGAAMLPFMGGGGSNPMSNPLSNGFSITHVSVQPGKGSANDRYQRMTQRRGNVAQGRARRSSLRLGLGQQMTGMGAG